MKIQARKTIGAMRPGINNRFIWSMGRDTGKRVEMGRIRMSLELKKLLALGLKHEFKKEAPR